MKAEGLNEVFFATIVFGLNGYFIANVCCGNEDYRENLPIRDEFLIREDLPHQIIHEEISSNAVLPDKVLPKFGAPLNNVTVTVGREAGLTCIVDNLQTYKIAWLRVDTQTILTIQNHVITKNHRMVILHTEQRRWTLKIKEIKESDRGWYMCQINTDPMKCQTGYLDVVVPPDILDYPTSSDMVVKEGSNVTFTCAATGSPPPTITWRREDGEPIAIIDGNLMASYNGSIYTIARTDRLKMGAYLCIASNGIPPSVSKRMLLIVHFPPMISIQNQLVGAAIGQTITLECQSEAFPTSINYWMVNESIITLSDRFLPERFENSYKVVMRLTIVSVDIGDYGVYKCLAKNSLGQTDGGIKLYHLAHSTVVSSTVPPTISLPTIMVTVMHNMEIIKEKLPPYKSSLDLMSTNNILIGATSGHWNADSRDRVLDHRLKNDGISSTEVQRDVDLLQIDNNELTSGASNYGRRYFTAAILTIKQLKAILVQILFIKIFSCSTSMFL